ncbi:hypothetical protein EGJ27_04160 [Pseudomonas sp. v388]|nr:hypothetical protein EGJ27_04160 [Pseudomonas sp. v388]
MKPLYGFCFYVPRRSEYGNKAPQRLYVAADVNENGMPPKPAPVHAARYSKEKSGLSDKTNRNQLSSAGSTLFRASFCITAVPVSA